MTIVGCEKREKNVDRRQFLKEAVLTGAAVAAAGAAYVARYDPRGGKEYFRDKMNEDVATLKPYRLEIGPSDPHFVVARGQNAEKMIQATLQEMGGVERFIKKGDVVIIKPNVAFDRAPILGATTNPETLKAVIRLCQAAGARRVLFVDNPINQPESCFSKTQIQKAALEAGAVLDATRVMMKNGPTGGSLADVKPGNTIICGVNMPAIDAYGYEMLLERDPANLDYLWKAEEKAKKILAASKDDEAKAAAELHLKLTNPRWKSVTYKEITV